MAVAVLIASACSQDPARQTADILEKAAVLYEQGKYGDVIAALAKVEDTSERHPPAPYYQLMAETYQKLHEFPKAGNILRKGLEFHPRSPELRLESIRLYLISFQLDKAAKALTELDPSNAPETAILRGDLATLRNNLDEAEQQYRRALQQTPASPEALVRLAICLIGQKKEDEADLVYTRLLDLSPLPPDTLLQVGNFWRLKEEPEKTLRFFKQAIAGDKGNLLFKKHLAEFYYTTQNNGAALKLVDESLKSSPTNLFFKKFSCKLIRFFRKHINTGIFKYLKRWF